MSKSMTKFPNRVLWDVVYVMVQSQKEDVHGSDDSAKLILNITKYLIRKAKIEMWFKILKTITVLKQI